ncbi:MAG: hypothetical protein RR359_05205 [Bacilli bacterium]
MRKIKLKKQNIFIILNVTIIFIITIFYASRLIHYYKIDNPKIKEQETLYKLLTLKKNIVTAGNGLYQDKNNFFYKGQIDNNYVKYSGRLFRVVSLNKNSVKMITEENQTSLVWGIDHTYEESYINNWLNKKDNINDTGIFCNSLNNFGNYVNNINNDNINLLTKKEYELSINKTSYLNNGKDWWLKDSKTYVEASGKIGDKISSGNSYYSYGVRPVIDIKSNIVILKGNGTVDNPYIFENIVNNVLNSKNIGDYLVYNNLTFRIIGKNNDYTKIVLDGFIKNDDKDLVMKYGTVSNIYSLNSGIGYYLNKTWINTLDKKYLVKGNINTNRYDSTVDYNYLKINDITINAYVGLLNIGDFFIYDYNDYFLGTRTSTYTKTVYKVTDKGKIYDDLITSVSKVRPVIFINKDVIVKTGNGLKNDPYILGEL